MRFTEEQILEQAQIIIDAINRPVDIDNPHDVMQKLNTLGCLLGNSSKCSSSAEYYYQTDKKCPEYHELRVLTETLNKDQHYAITILQTTLSYLRMEANQSRVL